MQEPGTSLAAEPASDTRSRGGIATRTSRATVGRTDVPIDREDGRSSRGQIRRGWPTPLPTLTEIVRNASFMLQDVQANASKFKPESLNVMESIVHAWSLSMVERRRRENYRD